MKVIIEGIAVGKTFFIENKNLIINNKKRINVNEEIKKIEEAKAVLTKTLKQNEDINDFTDWQVLLLNDPYLNEDIISYIKSKKASADVSVVEVFKMKLDKSKLSSNDDFFRSRFDEIINLSYSLAEVIKGQGVNCPIFDEDVILVANKLYPSDLMCYDLKKVKGIVLNKVSEFEHLAILASHLDIILIERNICEIINNTNYLIDTNKLLMTTDLTNLSNNDVLVKEEEKIKVSNDFMLLANISTLEDIKIAKDNGVKNIGLVRTEGIINDFNNYFEQLETYYLINESFDRVVFRLFDFKSDKVNDNNYEIKDLRSFIKQKDLLYKQLRAIINSSSKDEIYILVPQVRSLSDLIKIKMIINDINYQNKKQIKLGSMIESRVSIPRLNKIIKYSDFISVGTNDLIASVIKKERREVVLEDYFRARFNLALKKILKVAEINKKHATICGSIASNYQMIEILLKDFKVKALSVVPSKYKKINLKFERTD